MATETSTTRYVPKSRPATCDASPRFNWAMAVLSTVLVGGFYLDLWAHAHGRTDNTFFTPWHAVLYSMLAAVGIFLSIAAWRAWHRGAPWWESLPAGYGLSLVGVALFALGGVADLVWHVLFGVEFSVDALLSPTHLVLACAGILIVTGPLRAAWRDPSRGTRPWLARIPAVLSLALALSILTGFTQFVHPLVDPWAEVSPFASTAQSEIYLVDADGARQTRLTISRGANDGSPAFSAGGAFIVFTRSRSIAGRDAVGDVFRMAADGSDVTRLTRASLWYLGPIPSPDGQSVGVTFFRQDTRRWTIGLLPATGGDPRLLTDGQSNDILDGFSSDGTRVLFHSDREGEHQIYTIGVNGSGRTRLTSLAANWGGSWSLDGRTIAFNSNRTGRLQIYTMSPDGSNQRRLITSSSDDWLPSWSPDGTKIAFNSNRGGHTQVYVAHADGTGQQNVVQNGGMQLDAWSPGWSADGRQLVYAASTNPPADATPFVRQALGAAAIIVQAALLVGILLLGLRGGTLPVGSLTLIIGLNAVLLSFLQDQYRLIPGAILAGVLGDIVLWRLKPRIEQPGSIRLFTGAVPVIAYACYFLSLQLTTGIGWSIHLWLGTIVVAGIIGLLMSYLVLPPFGATPAVRA